jgi:hypothetical protein
MVGTEAPVKLQAGFEHGGWFEANGLRRGDLHRFARFWVAALASCALLHFESAESDDLDFLVLLHASGDGGEHGFEGFVSSTLGSVFSEGELDGFDQFSFVHGSHVSENEGEGWQAQISLK